MSGSFERRHPGLDTRKSRVSHEPSRPADHGIHGNLPAVPDRTSAVEQTRAASSRTADARRGAGPARATSDSSQPASDKKELPSCLQIFGDAWNNLWSGRPVSALLQLVTGTAAAPFMAAGTVLMIPAAFVMSDPTPGVTSLVAPEVQIVGIVLAAPGFAVFCVGEGACWAGRRLLNPAKEDSKKVPDRSSLRIPS